MAVARLQHFGESVPRATMETNENEFVARVGVDGRFTYVDPRYHSFRDHKAGFRTEGGRGGLEFPSTPQPEILKLSMVIIVVPSLLGIYLTMCHQNVVWKFVQDFVKSNLRGSKFKIFPGKGGAFPRPP